MATHSSILPGKFPGERSLVGYSPRGHKESDMTNQGHRQRKAGSPHPFLFPTVSEEQEENLIRGKRTHQNKVV